MNVNFLNPFVEAANEVLMAEMNVSTHVALSHCTNPP